MTHIDTLKNVLDYLKNTDSIEITKDNVISMIEVVLDEYEDGSGKPKPFDETFIGTIPDLPELR